MWRAVIFVLATFLVQIISVFITQWLNIFTFQPPLPETVLSKYYLNFVETVSLILSLFTVGIWIFDLKKSSLMHTNLKFVCYLICFHISTTSILQIVIIVDKYTNSIPQFLKMIITVIHGSARTQFTLDPAIAAIERGLATLKVAHYEKLTSRKQWVALMFVKELVGIIFFYFLKFTTIGAIFFGVSWICLLMATVIIGIILYRVNLRSYKTRIGTLHLTTRYQTVENIRCLKPVLLYSFLAVTQNIIAFILLIFLFVNLYTGNYDGSSVFESLINLDVAIFSIFYPLSFLLYSLRIRKFLKNKLKFYRRSSVSLNTVSVLSVMGKVLTSKNNQNIYFNQLKKSWN